MDEQPRNRTEDSTAEHSLTGHSPAGHSLTGHSLTGHSPAEHSLTAAEATERARLLEVRRYDLDLDLTALPEGPELRAVSTIGFVCRRPGAETFVDCLATVEEATLNGRPVPADAVAEGRIRLTGLQRDNVLVVRSRQEQTAQGRGVQRSVDPSDGRVYLWTSFEPDDARVVFACFDQPDLKAPFRITVTAPPDWLVLSNSGATDVTAVESGRRWIFADTPPLATYVPVVNAGPFHELRSVRGGHDLGLYTRRSLAAVLDRDAEELFELTEQGLAFFGEQFGMPFPQRRYDQAFVPELSGAMENYGCVTWADTYLYRGTPSYAEREMRALVLLHEMAHMWFGDMVTMRWWDDLWLNESFAEWACAWAATRATRFTDAWARMLATEKLTAYAADMAPTRHPIRQPIPDVATAAASFDAITYPKGAAVLKQLVAYVGEDRFLDGLRRYFAKHAWANTTLEDLIRELEEAGDRDLSSWVAGWLGTSGADELLLEPGPDGMLLRARPPGERPPLPHHLNVGVYAEEPGGLRRTATVPVEVRGEVTALAGVPVDGSMVLLVNDEDLTYASARSDDASWRTLLARGGDLPTPLGRTLVVTTAYELLMTGELDAADLVRCVAAVLPRETAESVVEPMLGIAAEVADFWAPPAARERLLTKVADVAATLLDRPEHHVAARRALARTATTDAQLARLAEVARSPAPGWRRLARLAELDRYDEHEAARLRAEDENPDAWASELIARAALPRASAKEAAWTAVFADRRVPQGSLGMLGRTFWRPGQEELLEPFAERFLEELPAMGRAGMLWAQSMTAFMYPKTGGGPDYPDRLEAATGAADVSPVVRQSVREGVDRLRRMRAARAR